jgi:hypothetical protein
VKKILILIFGLILLGSNVFTQERKNMLTGKFGINFFGYNTTYLTTGILYHQEVRDGMYIVGGVDFGISRVSINSQIVGADFLIPMKIGIEFPFQVNIIKYGFGTGITPCFQFTYDGSGADFLIGPYINGSIRIKVHSVMSIFLQIQQDLLFGKPNWIYTGTSTNIGITF